MTWLTDAMDSVGSTAKSVGSDLLDIGAKVVVTNAANMANNKLDALEKKRNTADANTAAPVAKGVNANGSTVVPGLNQMPMAASAGMPTWALVLGGVSLVALVVGVVIVARG
jgi:hypothetical protein